MALAVAALCAVALAGGAAVTGAHAAGGPASKFIIILRDQNTGASANSASWRSTAGAEQAPVVAQLQADGANNISSTSLVNAVSATVTASQAASLASNPAVAQVVPDSEIPGPTPAASPEAVPTASTTGGTSAAAAAPPCGSAASPELDPQALTNINATPAQLGASNGAGVTVAYLADGINPTNPDFQRNAAFASAGSPAGSPVITQKDFSGDGTAAVTEGGEAFLDASSIAAQGNQEYDLSKFVSPAHPLPQGCDIKIVGAAPGASVLALKIFAENHDTTTSGFLQAIQYAVANGVKVINESFGSNPFPDTTLDVIRQANDTAVADGVTVVVSSGDAGITSTIGSPSTDPKVIGVGASTTFRLYEQYTFGGINDPHTNGRWVDNNISSLSSGGYSQDGKTVDLVAPGDLNWALCDPNHTLFTDCPQGLGFQESGGTSESSPLTAAAAADVISAYEQSHHGADPTPALVKQILTSTATDIDAPATQQGAGLLNVAAAINEAKSINALSPTGGLLVPGQINVTQQPNATSPQPITLTNTSSKPMNVQLSTRALTHQAGEQTGSFCLQPGTPTASCPANTGTFQIWSGATEVYQDESFNVPNTHTPSRLEFSADYPYTGQTSVLHFALFEPDGTYAAYSLPQGLGDYGEVEVANPPAGKWTAVFFTVQTGSVGIGTSGTVQWDAKTLEYDHGDQIQPGNLTIAPGGTAIAQLQVRSPNTPGDSQESVVVSSGNGATTTVPVTVRTLVPTSGHNGGQFNGVLTGGNGRSGAPAQSNTYYFDVPSGQKDIDVSVALANDPNDTLIASLVDPNGQVVGYSSNQTTDSNFNLTSTRFLDIYHVNPEPGRWSLAFDWLNPTIASDGTFLGGLTGNELSEPFTGTIAFNQVQVNAGTLPNSSKVELTPGQTSTFNVTVKNTGNAPEAYFVDPRLNGNETIKLLNQNPNVHDSAMKLPLPAGFSFPYYLVPTHTSELDGSLTAGLPVQFDLSYFPGDPDIDSTQGLAASVTLDEPEVSPGFWLLNPDEVGPYPTTGAPKTVASGALNAVTNTFDPAVDSSTGDFWSWGNNITGDFDPVYVNPGDTATIQVSITPPQSGPTTNSGTLYLDDWSLAGWFGVAFPNGDELAAIPYSYSVGKTLTVKLAGSGNGSVTDASGAINCPTTCSSSYPAGSMVTLTEKPANDGSVFTGWSVPTCGTNTTCTVTMTTDQTVTATFSGGTLAGLQALLASFHLTGGQATDLANKLANASQQQGQGVCNALQGFTAAVLQDALANNPQLTIAQATQLVNLADQVQRGDGCNVPSAAEATAEQSLLTLAGTVNGWNLANNVANDLNNQLGNAGQALAQGHDSNACQALGQAASKAIQDATNNNPGITIAQAQSFVTGVNAIATALGCPLPTTLTSAAEQSVLSLSGTVNGWNLANNVANDLNNQLGNAGQALAQGNNACQSLGQAASKAIQDATNNNPGITIAQAQSFVTGVNAIATALGCSVPTTQEASAEQSVLALSATLSGLNLANNGAANDLQGQLGNIGQALAQGNDANSCQSIGQFMQKVADALSHNNLTAVQATTLTDAANAIGTSLSC